MPAESLEGKFTSNTEACGIFIPRYPQSRALQFSGAPLKFDPESPVGKASRI
jgi:hypothetical protein